MSVPATRPDIGVHRKLRQVGDALAIQGLIFAGATIQRIISIFTIEEVVAFPASEMILQCKSLRRYFM
jgi:hypothetical protein